MSVKELKDFGYDTEAYRRYLESADYMQDKGYDAYGKGNDVYRPVHGDWRLGHTHEHYDDDGKLLWERGEDHKKSQGKGWYHDYLKLAEEFSLTSAEKELVSAPKVYVKK